MLSLSAAMVAMAVTGANAGSGQTVLLDFYADWCGPCRSMMPTVQQLEAKGYPVRPMNVDQNRDLVQRFGITNIPCFVMIVDGREAGRVVGPTSLGRLEQLCSLGRPAPSPNTMLAGPVPAAAAPAVNYVVPDGNPNVCAVPAANAAPSATRQPVSDAALLAASVRLRVEDPAGHSCGSGTIIDALPGGEALVLTCGHLFRDSAGKGKVDVDVFGSAPGTHLPGRVLAFDLERDVAFVAFRPLGPVMVAHVAPPGYAIRQGDAVASVGCNNGEDPTVQRSQINEIERFKDPVELRLGHAVAGPHAPWNIEVAGQPVVGRSGGGLFSSDGMVIGVCNAAEPEAREGLFAALGTIHAALDQQRWTSLYQQAVAPPALVPSPVRSAGPADPQPAVAVADPFAGRNAASPVRIPSEQPPQSPPPAAVAAAVPAPPAASNARTEFSSSEQAVLEEIHRKLREGSEVVCIIRDRNDPKSKSEVITLDRASPVFVNQLARDAQGPVATHETALELAKPRTPILEWDAEAGWLHQSPLPR